MDKIACYWRVSTEDQSLDRQLTSTKDYAEREFGADFADPLAAGLESRLIFEFINALLEIGRAHV